MATIRDIAKEAGISPGAVSRILNQDETLSVSKETRERVLQIATRVGYTKPVHSAASKKPAFDAFSELVSSAIIKPPFNLSLAS